MKTPPFPGTTGVTAMSGREGERKDPALCSEQKISKLVRTDTCKAAKTKQGKKN